MKTASVIVAALALTAGLAAAQTETSTPESQQSPPSSSQLGQPTQKGERGAKTDYGQDRRVKKGTAQTYNTGATGAAVGTDQPATVKGADQTTAASNEEHGARGTGVATGFVAAGIGLAILGLFVQRRSRHDYPDDYGPGPGAGPGTGRRR